MRTVGEVIAEVEQVMDCLEKIDCVFYCNLRKNCKRGGDCCFSDILHYLYLVEAEEDNPPLTLDELQQMIGKPVWFEVLDQKALPALEQAGWCLVGTRYITREGVLSINLIRIGVTYSLPIAEYGKTWNAYRKERDHD